MRAKIKDIETGIKSQSKGISYLWVDGSGQWQANFKIDGTISQNQIMKLQTKGVIVYDHMDDLMILKP